MPWHRQPDSVAFVRWLYNHPRALAGRAAWRECKEAVVRERDATVRSELGGKGSQLTVDINDAPCRATVTKRRDQRGNLVWPRAAT